MNNFLSVLNLPSHFSNCVTKFMDDPKVVKPKKQKLREAEKEVARQMEVLESKRKDLAEITERLQKLNDEFGKMTQKKKDLEQQIRSCQIKIERAERLISGLGGEERRWENAMEKIKKDREKFVGDVLLAAALVVYFSWLDEISRQKHIDCLTVILKGQNIQLMAAPYRLSSALVDQSTIQLWHSAGLPEDQISVDNASMIFCSRQWPLIIDPHGEAKKWLRNLDKRLITAKHGDLNLVCLLENAVSMGLWMLVDNVTCPVQPALAPLIDLQMYKQGKTMYIRLGGKILEYNDRFRLFLSTPDWNFKLEKRLRDKICLVNFQLTRCGVEEKMLDIFVSVEAPQLQQRRMALLAQSNENQKQLKLLEDQILHILVTTKGNILEDEEAVEMLANAKDVSDVVSKKQVAVKNTEKEIDVMRNGYRNVAQHACQLFFVLIDLSRVNPVYQFSLDWFITLYRKDDPKDYENDCPITEMGDVTAQMIGRAMRLTKLHIDAVYTSPALSCVQTAHGILKALNANYNLKMCVEPGLFEWLAWYDAVPRWMSPKEMINFGMTRHSVEEMRKKRKNETASDHYNRMEYVTNGIIHKLRDTCSQASGHVKG